ncbi:MAG: hypothetical protein IPI81_13685 [Flavobacteriales bacterium]|nr:hypothetical protein [Flavobacteriales bacterium]MCC6937353.1 hypothetical protein [Flavobacteriales bacterium]
MEEGEDNSHAVAGSREGFPVYRRLNGAPHYYRIDGPGRFTEVQVVGGRSVIHEVLAKAYPEQLRVAQMIDGDQGRYLPISVGEWETICP